LSWWEEFSSWLAWVSEALGPFLPYMEMLIVVVVAVVVERVITRRVRKAVRRLELPPDAGNAIILAVRVIILVAACVTILNIGGVHAAWLVSLSALGGTAIGFASTRSVGNLIAGIYIMVARPFGVGDYVRIDGLEGEVVEITVNYTKLRAPDGTVLLISNQKVLDSKVENFAYEGPDGRRLVRGSFRVSFDHSIPSGELERAFEALLERWAGRLPERPAFRLSRWDKGGKEYTFTFSVEEASDLLAVRHELLREVLRTWEELKARRS